MSGGEIDTQFVTFSLDKEVFAAPVAQVREILDYTPAFKIPNGPAYFLGLIDVRGQGVPTLDLRMRLGLGATEPTTHTRILVLDILVSGRVLTLGLVADRVFEVATISPDDVEAAPDVGAPWASEYISGVVKRPEGFVVLMDVGKLLSTADAGLFAGAATPSRAA